MTMAIESQRVKRATPTLLYLLVTASVLALAAQALAADCAEWGTHEFFKSATLEEVRGCLEAGAEVDTLDYPLHQAAASSDNPAVITALVDAGAWVNAGRILRDGATPLHDAAQQNENPAVITALVAAGARVNAREGVGGNDWTPLHKAAMYNDNPAIITVLVATGARVNAWSGGDLTPLHWAAWNNLNPAVITALVDAGAWVNARTERGHTPLHVAAQRNVWPTAIEALLDAGADMAARDEDGHTPWDYAKDRYELKTHDVYRRLAVHAGAMDCAEWNTSVFFELATLEEVVGCLTAGAEINAQDEDGSTPLHRAAWTSRLSIDNPGIIAALVDAGAEVDAQDRIGSAPPCTGRLGTTTTLPSSRL